MMHPVASAYYLQGKNNSLRVIILKYNVASAYYLQGKNNANLVIGFVLEVASAYYLQGKNNCHLRLIEVCLLHLPTICKVKTTNFLNIYPSK